MNNRDTELLKDFDSMHLHERGANIFKKEKFKIPIKFKTDDITKEVAGLLDAYRLELSEVGVDENICHRIDDFNKYCSLIYRNYFMGWHSSAFENFKKAIKILDIENNTIIRAPLGNDILYRGRTNDSYQKFKFDDMVHIPLDCRYLVQTQRFSFPGLPCFYAGASVYSCWNELNKPTIDSFQVASFMPKESISNKVVLDLSRITTEKMKIDNNYYLYWPLVALCSIKVKHEDAPFKAEYIFPQYLLEYIQSKNRGDIIGIKYASIKVLEMAEAQREENWHTYVNYVFPTQAEDFSGKLDANINANFKQMKNKSGKEIQIIRDYINRQSTRLVWETFEGDSRKTFEKQIDDYRIILEGGEAIPYLDTIFGITEKVLRFDVTYE